MILNLKKIFPGIPTEISIFLVRALVIFICWKALYHFVLYPSRFPDEYITDATARIVTWVYNGFLDGGKDVVFVPGSADGIRRTTVLFNGTPRINIADSCNALELHVIYIAFLFCLRTTLKRQLKYLAIGVVTIFILNVLRCLALLWLSDNHIQFFHFAHHYLFYLIVYSYIFYLWYLYSKKIKFAE
jgi:exosortase/archaeosortase family protein